MNVHPSLPPHPPPPLPLTELLWPSSCCDPRKGCVADAGARGKTKSRCQICRHVSLRQCDSSRARGGPRSGPHGARRPLGLCQGSGLEPGPPLRTLHGACSAAVLPETPAGHQATGSANADPSPPRRVPPGPTSPRSRVRLETCAPRAFP